MTLEEDSLKPWVRLCHSLPETFNYLSEKAQVLRAATWLHCLPLPPLQLKWQYCCYQKAPGELQPHGFTYGVPSVWINLSLDRHIVCALFSSRLLMSLLLLFKIVSQRLPFHPFLLPVSVYHLLKIPCGLWTSCVGYIPHLPRIYFICKHLFKIYFKNKMQFQGGLQS